MWSHATGLGSPPKKFLNANRLCDLAKSMEIVNPTPPHTHTENGYNNELYLQALCLFNTAFTALGLHSFVMTSYFLLSSTFSDKVCKDYWCTDIIFWLHDTASSSMYSSTNIGTAFTYS